MIKYKTQNTKYSCGAVALHNALLCLGKKENINSLRVQLKEKPLFGVYQEDLTRVIKQKGLRYIIRRDTKFKYYNHPNQIVIIRINNHLVTLHKITNHYIYLTNNYNDNSRIKEYKPICKISKKEFYRVFDYYIVCFL